MNSYKQVVGDSSETHFSSAVSGELEFSKMIASPTNLTTFNAGDIVPIFCEEVLPHDRFSVDLDFVIRQTTLLTPTMGSMEVDFHAFFVPNRIVNQSFKTVMGENVNGSWSATSVSLAPLFDPSLNSEITSVQIPVGSVADYYGYPTQDSIPVSVLSQCHDLKFRGYIEIYNEFFRDQNYQPPIPYSKLNVYEGFLKDVVTNYNAGVIGSSTIGDNSYGGGSIQQAVYGNLTPLAGNSHVIGIQGYGRPFYAVDPPLKANKLHDYFTSVLPSPQKGPQVFVPVSGVAPVVTSSVNNASTSLEASRVFPNSLRWISRSGVTFSSPRALTTIFGPSSSTMSNSTGVDGNGSSGSTGDFVPVNLRADLSNNSVTLDVNDLRMAASVQQIYEQLARGGSRYREYVRSFFGLDVEDPYKDIPTHLGHIRRKLDLYQTAQTSPSESDSTPQGNLAAFGYTSSGGKLFDQTFLEHGYIHIFAIVRQKNIYPSYLGRDNFRLSMLDFYQPQLANISEQPVYTKQLNPFVADSAQVFGYQEPFAEYRYIPDRVTGYMRPGISNSLALWNYADDFNSSLTIATGDWIKSNAQVVLDRTLAVTSSVSHQFKGQFNFKVEMIRPMPVYSVPGLDIV